MAVSTHSLTCACSRVQLTAHQQPIVATICHCAACQQAGEFLQRLPDAPTVLRDDGGTDFVLYRKDRVDCVKGCELLRAYRLNDTTPTRRVVATCCNTYMFLDFTKGHWVTILRDRFDPAHAEVAAVKPAPQNAFFIARLVGAWARMGFRTPRLAFVQGDLGKPAAGPTK